MNNKFSRLIFNLMKSNSRINKQEQVQVVIRLKPQSRDNKYQRCAYLASENSNALVVEVPTKKEFFVFDAIANEDTSQLQLYQNIGRQAVQQTLEGYNCCIFAYGQTGSGKTYSILGILQDIVDNIYADTRGILPRLMEDLITRVKQAADKSTVKCSYMEIYNQQIFDLLSDKLLNLQLRQAPQKGVFVEGINNFDVDSYQDAMSLVLQGQKNRKIAQTGMNKESSRSHTIFTLNVQSEILQNDTVKFRKSKINIVDLAGSERVKHTNVEGQRLKQGCNINKSLHVLGNVINALVESTKKKKHIPFRDSKLTYYLKDSLGGNSITKLLANIQCNSKYLGDTLSTLMFAKRAKILKMKVQVNENTTENYEALRKQIKKLRQQLAQAKYINQTRLTERFPTQNQNSELNFQKFDTSNVEYSSTDNPIQVFEENELNYKALIEIYEQHMSECSSLNNQNFNSSNNKFVKKKTSNLPNHSEWKKLQKKNAALLNLVKRIPAFTKIYRENQLLKQQRGDDKKVAKGTKELFKTERKIMAQQTTLSFCQTSQVQSFQQSWIRNDIQDQVIEQAVQKTIQKYEIVINEMKTKFNECLNTMDRSYNELQRQIDEKDKKIRQISKRQNQLPPNIQQLVDENQYLKLNILELQAEVSGLQKQLDQIKIKQREEGRRYTLFQEPHSCKKKQSTNQNDWMTQSLNFKQIQSINEPNHFTNNIEKIIQNCSELQLCNDLIESLQNFRKQALSEVQNYDFQRQKFIDCIQALQKQCKKLLHTNKSLTLKNENLKIQKNQIIIEIKKLHPQTEIPTLFKTQNLKTIEELRKELQKMKAQDQEIEIYKEEVYIEIQGLTAKIKQLQGVKQELDKFLIKQKATQKEFGKSINQILEEYAEMIQKNSNQQQSISSSSRLNVLLNQKLISSPQRSKFSDHFSGGMIWNAKNYGKKRSSFEQQRTGKEEQFGVQIVSSRVSEDNEMSVTISPQKQE